MNILKVNYDFGGLPSSEVIINNEVEVSSYVSEFRLIGIEWHGEGAVPHWHLTLIMRSTGRTDKVEWSFLKRRDLNGPGTRRNKRLANGDRYSYKQRFLSISFWKWFISWHPSSLTGKSPIEAIAPFSAVFKPIYIPFVAPKPHKRKRLQKFATKQELEAAKVEALVHQSLEEGTDKPILDLYSFHKEQVRAVYCPKVYDGGFFIPGFGFSCERVGVDVTPTSVTFHPELMG
jgi:hypothetical protein